jgi:ADP-ribose pyrophosphatase YjhB (NUDIX family)
LMHHLKLWMWLQFWWHADWDMNIKNVALRELEEESWIKENDIVILDDIYDIDIHEIPARKLEPAHFHYDIRFLAIVREDIKIIREEKEAKEIKWCDINEILENKNFNTSTSLHRMLENL